MNVFEWGTRNNVRFQVPEKGLVTIEDLWKINLQKLADLEEELETVLNKSTRHRFKKANSKEQTENQIKYDIVKYILDVRIEEINQREVQAETKQQLQMLLELKAKKQQESLENLPMEQIDAEIAKLKQSI